MNYSKFGKTFLDLVESLVLTEMFTTEFWQELLITLFVIVSNALIIPSLKLAYDKLKHKTELGKYLTDEDFATFVQSQTGLKVNDISKSAIKELVNKYKEK